MKITRTNTACLPLDRKTMLLIAQSWHCRNTAIICSNTFVTDKRAHARWPKRCVLYWFNSYRLEQQLIETLLQCIRASLWLTSRHACWPVMNVLNRLVVYCPKQRLEEIRPPRVLVSFYLACFIHHLQASLL